MKDEINRNQPGVKYVKKKSDYPKSCNPLRRDKYWLDVINKLI